VGTRTRRAAEIQKREKSNAATAEKRSRLTEKVVKSRRGMMERRSWVKTNDCGC
jgi:hypothetical protein